MTTALMICRIGSCISQLNSPHTIEFNESLNDLLCYFWWYLEDNEFVWDELTHRERVKVLNYFKKEHVTFPET